MAKELSPSWWNIIRRKMRATPAEEDPSARCPDCNGSMHLMEGRYGRFYGCDRYECQGTLGARLDGTVRPPQGTPEQQEARRRARLAVARVCQARSDVTAKFLEETQWQRVGDPWWNHRPDCSADFHQIIMDARLLDPDGPLIQRITPGLHIRRRSIEECQRIEKAASEWFLQLRALRKNAWDRLAVGVLDD